MEVSSSSEGTPLNSANSALALKQKKIKKPKPSLKVLIKDNVEHNSGLVAQLQLDFAKWVLVLFANLSFWILISLVFQTLEGSYESTYKCGRQNDLHNK